MTQPHLKAVARFVRDLLDYDEQLIKFDRRNVQASDFSTSYIVVNGSLPQSVLARGQRFNGDAEVMTYSASVSHAIVLEFYGDKAYVNAESFMMLSESQHANELRRTHSLTIMAVSNIIDVGQLLGQSHGIDDLLTAMEGGQSVIADFFKDTWGIDIVPGLLAIKDAVIVVVDYIIAIFKQGIDNIKLLFSALSKLVTGDFQGAWDDVVKSFTDSVALLRKPFDEFMKWVLGLFANLGETIKNTISNAASNAWNATKSFFGFGEDEQPQGVTGGGNGGMSPGGIPYGMNAAVGLGSDSSSYNNSYSFSQQNYITAPDATAAGAAVVDRSQQQMSDARRMYSGNGR